jgi:hypothetical protein
MKKLNGEPPGVFISYCPMLTMAFSTNYTVNGVKRPGN